jgi:hypothetical protein
LKNENGRGQRRAISSNSTEIGNTSSISYRGSILFSVQHQGKKDALVPSKPITSAAEQYSNSYT